MEKPVIISIKGTQSFADSGDDSVELITQGHFSGCGEEGFALSYQESELTGMNGTLTTLQIEKDRITLVRVGAVNSQMVFEAGRRHLSMYHTAEGALSVGINTRRMSALLDEHGGDIRIQYSIEIDHAVAGENQFHIHIRESGVRGILS